MKRTLIALVAVVGMATAANGASLTVTADQTSYAPSDTITLSVVGDGMGAPTLAVLVNLLFGGSGSVGWVSGTQVQQTSFTVLPWTTQPLTGNSNSAVALSQLAGLTPLVPDNLFSATIILHANGSGTVNVGYDTAPGPNQLDFFGVTTGGLNGTSFTIVPEPTTAGLLGLGLLSLAVAGRRR